MAQREEQLKETEYKLRHLHGKVAELERTCESQAATLKKREALIGKALVRLEKINKRREALSRQLVGAKADAGNRSFVSFTTKALRRF